MLKLKVFFVCFCSNISIEFDVVYSCNTGIYSIHIQFPEKLLKIKKKKIINFKVENSIFRTKCGKAFFNARASRRAGKSNFRTQNDTDKANFRCAADKN